MADLYSPPPFGEVISDEFVYVGWSVHPVRLGPFLRPSRVRRRTLDRLREVAGGLAARPEVSDVRLFRTTVIVPVPGSPPHDVVMLIRIRGVAAARALLDDATLAETEPVAVFTARNGARFGCVDGHSPATNILLNHFTGVVEETRAVDTWRSLSAWFADKTGIDNSTLLVPDLAAPFVLVNYARVPGSVPGFMARQLLRPSFYRYVRPLLARHHLTSLPIFVRPVELAASR